MVNPRTLFAWLAGANATLVVVGSISGTMLLRRLRAHHLQAWRQAVQDDPTRRYPLMHFLRRGEHRRLGDSKLSVLGSVALWSVRLVYAITAFALVYVLMQRRQG